MKLIIVERHNQFITTMPAYFWTLKNMPPTKKQNPVTMQFTRYCEDFTEI